VRFTKVASMKKVLKELAATVLSIYILSFVFAGVYFNWQYAKRHGFTDWLALGELSATAKAFVWPYYAINGDPYLSQTDPSFANSRASSRKTLEIVARFDGVLNLPPNEASEVVQLLEASVIEADLTKDSYLQMVHAEFPHRFRTDYTKSLRNLADGIRTGDEVKVISAIAVYNSFSDWVKSTADAGELAFP